MGTLAQDLRYGLRMLSKRPGFTAIAILTLALGVGANSAIFSVVNAVLLRSLPYPESERLLLVGQQYAGGEAGAAGEPKFLFWREHSQSFEAMAAYQHSYGGSGFNLAGGDEAEFVTGLKASVDFFRVLGVSPALGRSFTPEEDSPGGERVLILSDGLWRRRFGADAGVVGRTVSLNGQNYTVIGVMPPQFQFPPSADIIVPMRPSLQGDPDPNSMVIGRLKPGVTREQAQAEMRLIADQYRDAFPNRMQAGESVGVRPYQELFTGDARPLLMVLLGAVGFLLAIACANVANLQLTRATARRKEIAIRQALGASGWRIARQLLTEGVLLALMGGAAGLLLAMWGADLLAATIPQRLVSRLHEISFDWRVLAFTFATAIVTGLLFGLAPAVQAAGVDLNAALKEGAGKGTAGAGRGRLRNVLVVAEVALALVLLIGATLLIRTFVKLRGVEPGFDAQNVLTFQVSPSGERYDTAQETAELFRNALGRIRSLPGVESAAVTSTLPLVAQFRMPVALDGRPDIPESIQFRMITPDYFRALKIPVQQGRPFTETDTAGAESVAIVNEAFAHKYLSDVDPLSQRLTVGRGGGDAPRRIVGVVGDLKQFGLDSEAPPMIFIPVAQASDRLLLMIRRFTSTKFVVRAAGEPLSLSAAVRREMAALDATLPVAEIRAMEEIVAQSIAPQRFNMLLIGAFACLGLLLAAVGIYGVMSYSVSQRTQEIGIRVALGAQASDVLRLVVGQGMAVALIGVALGLLASYALTRLLESLLYGVSATDPVTFVMISLLLAVVALLACYLPARRATKVDPIVALRHE